MSNVFEVEVKVTGFYKLSFKAKDITEAHRKAERKLLRIESGYVPPKDKLINQYAIYEELAQLREEKETK